jgi:hypothetical protein
MIIIIIIFAVVVTAYLGEELEHKFSVKFTQISAQGPASLTGFSWFF